MVEVRRGDGAIPQDPADALRREFAWPLLDSINQVIGYIREVPARPPVTSPTTGQVTDAGVKPRSFRLWNDAKAFMGTTNPDVGQRLQMEGQPCATVPAGLRNTTSLIALFADGGSRENGNALTVRGLLPTAAFAAQSFTNRSGISNSDAVRSYYAPCSRPKKFLRNSVTFNYKAPAFAPDRTERVETSPGVFQDRMVFGDRYQSRNAVENDKSNEPGTCAGDREVAATQARCSAPYINYTFPQVPGTEARPQYPRHAVLVPGTTAVNGGGLTRGLLVTKGDGILVRAVDRFRYLDKNIPCGQDEVASWTLIRTGKIYLWAPRRVGDDNNPAPSRPALALPAVDPTNGRACTP